MARPPLLALAAAGVLALAGAASGEDREPAPRPQPLRRLEHPFVSAVLGDWDVVSRGVAGESRAKASFRLGVAGTALLHDYASVGAADGFAGHGVYRLGDDGRTITTWWFDSHAPDAMRMSGPLTPTGAELNGTSPQGPLTIRWRVVEAGLELTMSAADRVVFVQEYRRPPR